MWNDFKYPERSAVIMAPIFSEVTPGIDVAAGPLPVMRLVTKSGIELLGTPSSVATLAMAPGTCFGTSR